MIRTLIITVAALLQTIPMQAQQKKYTLDECKELAIKNNVEIQKSQLELEAAQQTKKKALTGFFPSISASLIGFGTTKPMMDAELPIGSFLDDPAMPPVPLSMMKKGGMGMVTATQPIFAGGQIFNGNKLAKVGMDVAELRKKVSSDEVLITVEQYFWNVVTLKEKIQTTNEAKLLLNRVYEDVNNSYEAGLINKNDLLKVELRLNELESNELKLKNGLKISKMILAQYIGLSTQTIEIDNTLPSSDELVLSFKTDHSTALVRRAEYLLLDKSIEANKLQLKMEIGKNLPTLAIGAGWNYMNFDKGSPMSMENNFGLGFATISIPITSWWGGSHAIKKQKIEIKISEREKQNAEEMLLIQMQQLWNEVEESFHQVQLSKKTIASALENVRLNETYYKAGTGILTDLLDAQSSLQQARDQYVEAISQYQLKLSRYKQATSQY